MNKLILLVLLASLVIGAAGKAETHLSIEEVCELAREHGNGVPPSLVVAQVWEESGGQVDIVSSAGAVGLLQVIQRFHPDKDLTDPVVNMDVGTHVLISDFFYLNHIRSGLDQNTPASEYGWDDKEWLYRALAGYVMGPGNVVWYDKHPDKSWPANVMGYATNIDLMYQQDRCN